ncbi:cysteine hydrolase family protein [Mycolicibacterium obuense]|uniref:Peroxyureidoacrylate/ureidoacrylate amidohydrolase RutB n=1 Tax=Mycolicibacterium obuense TaxID=1807 RepID=A0A0J6VDP0_9MYCO|nr:isochorismatase family cysteine hydrolase [Mycolicibacterium obuense]KMO68284.1 Peroxyureidoacrylate/ureidoacrylate amidohydrolase RutB [Mycolicibacterium obuense]OKH75986.1 cysteine hydrolase [Mycobacterium sp. SWH-M1]
MPKQPLIVGNPVLVVVDMQEAGGMPAEEVGIEHMPGYDDRIARAQRMIDAARAAGIPIVFFQEVHRPSGIDFGRELDGVEGEHCVEGRPGTPLHPALLPEFNGPNHEFHIVKRRYSGFIGTEFEIVLSGLKADTLILVGGLTDVCVHYTFADAHQRDFYVRVVTDCVGGSTQYRHDAALDAMEYLQTGAMRTTEEIVDAFNEIGAATNVLEGAAR